MTETNQVYKLRQLGIGEIYSQSFSVAIRNFSTLVGLMALVYVPFYLCIHFITQAMLPAEPTNFDELASYINEVSSLSQNVNIIAGLLETLIIVPITAAAVMFIVAGLYSGKRITIGAALSLASGRLLPLLLTYVLTTLAIFGGLILLIIPGIIFAVWFLLATEVTVFEGIDGPKALGRSKTLMRGASASLLLLIIGYAITFLVIGIAGEIVLAPLPTLFAVIGKAVIQAICVLVVQVGWVLYYFSARCRHETFTPEMLGESLVLEVKHADELSTESSS